MFEFILAQAFQMSLWMYTYIDYGLGLGTWIKKGDNIQFFIFQLIQYHSNFIKFSLSSFSKSKFDLYLY